MTATSKWTAFLLSACIPGAGQLAAKSWTCLPWFTAAGCLALAFQFFGQSAESSWLKAVHVCAGIALCLTSAEHAKRLLEPRRSVRSSVVSATVNCAGGGGRRVRVAIVLTMNRRAQQLWEQVSDLPQFLTIDPFHDKVILMRDRPAAGVDLALSHNAFGWRFLRFGRILAWHDGVSYTFSDLSARGRRSGFPHVFQVKVEPLLAAKDGTPLSQLTIDVRGRWTSRLVPVWIGRLWIRLVCLEHARLLQKGL